LQDKDVEGKIAGVQGHYIRKELYDDGQVWGKPKHSLGQKAALVVSVRSKGC
jgi:hypothetical protein